MKKTLVFSLMVFIYGMSVDPSQATLFTFEDGTSPAEITGGQIRDTGGYGDYGFGDYYIWSNGDAITLTLTNLDPQTPLNLDFDLAIIDSWDGTNERWGLDLMNVTMDGTTIFSEAFSQFHDYNQTYTGEALISGEQLAVNTHWLDSAYHISLTDLQPQSDTLVLQWFANGSGWQGYRAPSDESFAIDNINITAAVPEPATMLLFGTGLAGLATLRRKRQGA